MKKIGYALSEHPIYKEVKPILLRGLGIIGKDILRNLALRYAMTEKGIEELDKNLLPKMDILSKVDKDTIYFDGIDIIEKEMKKIMKKSIIVVFVDDLDRCSPEKALEVFESIKVFLDIEGLVFVIGLSHEALDKLITARYEKIGVTGIKGEQYIQKIIQTPITLQDWNDSDIWTLLNDLLEKGQLDRKYVDIIRSNMKLIASVLEPNPREVKRFINNFIMAYEIYSSEPHLFTWDDITGKDESKFKEFLKERFRLSWVIDAKTEKTEWKQEIKLLSDEKHSLIIRKEDNRPRAVMIIDDWKSKFEFVTDTKNDKLIIYPPQVRPTELLIIQALKERWKAFYIELSSNRELREELLKNIKKIKNYFGLSEEDRKKTFEDLKADKTSTRSGDIST
jgi:hypothetical protein